jgi:predicted Zn-dependent peptidase
MEMISDIAFNSSFPDREVEKEKEIIFDEINSYKDSPSELIFDEFEELIFDGNSLGRNILGEESKLRTFTRETILDFIRQNYSTQKMVVSSVGKIPFDTLVKSFTKYFGHYPFKSHEQRGPAAYSYKATRRVTPRGTFQAPHPG